MCFDNVCLDVDDVCVFCFFSVVLPLFLLNLFILNRAKQFDHHFPSN